MKTLALRKAKINAVGVVGLVENMVSGIAQRPGDIVKSFSGKTIEVLNTDAEGRLVLADALTYTEKKFKPRLIIDLATLTGAIIVSLGSEYAGLFSNNDKLSKQIINAGETAEMPGIYSKDKFDLAGFSVGLVSKKKILDKIKVKSGDVVLAIPSSGIHSNGFSLIRSILKKNKIPKKFKNELLKPTKIYSKEILELVEKNLIHSAAHITGGGLIENILRSVPKKLSLNLNLSRIRILKIFKWIKKYNISDKEMMRTFNCGVGFCVICPKKMSPKLKSFFQKNISRMKLAIFQKILLK